ncbi:PAS domain S-box protein [Vibrio cionasavignyae]|uniref:PAS domain S-box protein n=1 Tax=Vibrio cionasavignyae TaxID=2910252 RepID=UPI003D0F2F39
MNNELASPTKRMFLSEWLLWAIPAYIALSVLMSFHYLMSIENDKQYALHNERVIVNLIEEVLGETLVRMTADAKNLSYITSELIANQVNPKKALAQFYRQSSANNPNYDQIRYIDNLGHEQLRINNYDGHISIVPQAKLQNKAHRYYWQFSNNLQPEQVFISPMDLNIEGGEIQKPIKPTIRVGTPVFSKDGRRLGVIILNYKGRQLINKLFTVAPSFTNHVYLYNPQGAAVIHPIDKGKADFVVNSNRDISHEVLSQLQQQKEGQTLFENNYYTFSQISAPNNGDWTIISVFPVDRFNLSRAAFSNQYTIVYFIAFLIATIASTVFCRYRVQGRYLRQQQAYEQQFRHTLENIQLAAVTINPQGNITFCNDFFLSMVGYQKQDVVGFNWVERFIPVELQAQAQEALEEAIRQQTHQPHSESVVLSHCGEIHLVSWTSTFTKSHDSAVSLTLIGEDVTEQKMAQDQLQQLSHAVESSQNSVMITDLDNKIIYVNPVFCELSGYSRDEVMGLSPKILQSGETPTSEYQSIKHTLRAGKEWRGEFHNKKKNGELYWERARISPVKNIEGRPLYYVAVKQDISEEKRLEKEVTRQTRDRIQHEKLAAVGKVVNMIAHDLRNPLSSIKMVLQIHARNEKNEMFDISLEQVRFMEAILEELLAYSKPDQFKPEWIDINKLLETILASQQKLAMQSNVELLIAFQPHLPTIYADPIKLRQAIQNILLNAMQASQSTIDIKPTVKLSTNIMITDSGTQLLIDIENNGQSIDPCLTEKVFEPFFTTKAKGTGLGLAIVKRIIDSHQGQITLSPISPMGTQTRIRIPTAPQAVTPVKEAVNG